MTRYRHGANNSFDRVLGEKWEARFIEHCVRHGLSARSIPQRNGSPDVMAGPDAHEVKHKRPLQMIPFDKAYARRTGHARGPIWGFFLEDYRIDLFREYQERTGCPVYYTIHDWSFNGSRESERDVLEDWRTQSLDELLADTSGWMNWSARSYKSGSFGDEEAPGKAFHWVQFEPLTRYFVGEMRGLTVAVSATDGVSTTSTSSRPSTEYQIGSEGSSTA